MSCPAQSDRKQGSVSYSVFSQSPQWSDMARPPWLLTPLAALLAVLSAKPIDFGRTTCKVDGVTGTCLAFRDCPTHVAHYKAGRISPLQDALKSCSFLKAQMTLCCPTTSQRMSLPTARRFQNHQLCGTSNFNPSRIVGGFRVGSLKEFPWMAALKWDPDGRNQVFRCGGAIINERWVLTAGHCITDDGPVSVRVRDLDLSGASEDSLDFPPEDVMVERAFRHPNYSRTIRGLSYDIGLLKLEKDLVFSEISKPLCLPEGRRTTADYERIRRSYIAGWGLLEYAGRRSSHMMWAAVNITNHRDCQESYRRQRFNVTDEQHLCASGDDLTQPGCDPGANDGSCSGGVDACEGDSGGPLMLSVTRHNMEHYEAVGVISFGSGCGSPSSPGVYARVDHFMDWIAETVNGN